MPAVSNVIIRKACSWHAASAAAPSSAAVRATNEMTYEVAESRFDTARKVMSFKKKMRFAGKHTQLKSTKSAPTIERSEAAKAVVMTVSSSGVSPVKLESELARAVAGTRNHSSRFARPDLTARVVHGAREMEHGLAALPRARHRPPSSSSPMPGARACSKPCATPTRRQNRACAARSRSARGGKRDFTVGRHGLAMQPDRTEIPLDYLPGGCLDTLLERNARSPRARRASTSRAPRPRWSFCTRATSSTAT